MVRREALAPRGLWPRHNTPRRAFEIRNPQESAEKLTRTFAGEKGPVRDYILANSAAALWVARQIPLLEGAARAAAAIDTGAVSGLLEQWRRLTPVATSDDAIPRGTP